jgi:hypothetical protein
MVKMKTLFSICLIIIVSTACHSQILKRITQDVKNEAEWKLRAKTRQKTSEAIDSILSPKKKPEKKQDDKKTNSQNTDIARQDATLSSKQSEVEEMSMGEGFIDLSLSATEVFRGGTVIMTGTSIKYGTLSEVKVTITGEGIREEQKLKLYDNGSFAAGWNATKAGEFTITVKSSDGKDQKSAKVKVYAIDVMDDLWVKDNTELTNKCYDKLNQEADRVKQGIGAKDKTELEQKMVELKKKVDATLKLFNDLETAADKLATVAGKEPLPSVLSDNLSELNDQLFKQKAEMQQMYDAANHQPYDNTICEYLVMLNEALAAFSTITNIWAKSITAALKNIALDKAVPKQVEMVNEYKVKAGPTTEFLAKEGSKIFATALDDAKALESVAAKAGIAGDVAQFVTEILLKTYCGIFKGQVTNEYTITYRNKDNVVWWQYSYTTKAAVTFRYPKSTAGSIIKMKGNIEGNATSFKFRQDVEQMDEFKEQMKNRAQLIPIELHAPLGVPFATSQADVLGFGAITRSLITPSYFNIPVDADYNTDEGKIKLFINEPIIDFTPAVQYLYAFISFPMGIPVATRVNFPINKAKLTLNAVVSKNNELTVTKDGNNNLIVKGSGNRLIGSETAEIEHKISYSLDAKNN